MNSSEIGPFRILRLLMKVITDLSRWHHSQLTRRQLSLGAIRRAVFVAPITQKISALHAEFVFPEKRCVALCAYTPTSPPLEANHCAGRHSNFQSSSSLAKRASPSIAAEEVKEENVGAGFWGTRVSDKERW